MMNRSIVMTSDPFTMPIRRERDRAALIGSEYRDAVSREPGEHLGRRMTVIVVPAHADHRSARLELVQPLVRRCAPRAVMADLQEVHPTHRPYQPAFDREPRAGLEQEARSAVPHPQHYAMLIHIERHPEPQRAGAQDFHHPAVHLDSVPRARRMPPRARGLDASKKLEIQRPE